MTEEQKEELKEYTKRRYQNMTEEQRKERREKVKEYNKRKYQNISEESNEVIT